MCIKTNLGHALKREMGAEGPEQSGHKTFEGHARPSHPTGSRCSEGSAQIDWNRGPKTGEWGKRAPWASGTSEAG